MPAAPVLPPGPGPRLRPSNRGHNDEERAIETLTVVLGTGLPPLMDTLNLVAEGAGFFRAEDLTVRKIAVPGAAAALQACALQTADICPIGIERLFTGYERGMRAQLFLAWASRYTYVLAVPGDSPIRTLTDFAGATIGVHEVGPTSTGQATITSMLLDAGLQPHDFTFAAIGFNNLDALANKSVAGAGFPYYEMIPFQVAGANLRIFENPLLTNMPSGGYAAAPATIAAKPSALQRFARAIVKAALLVQFNPAGAARLIGRAQYAPALDLWRDRLPARDPANPRIGFLPPDAIAAYGKLLSDSGLTDAPVPAEAVVDNRFNAFANDVDREAVAALAKTLP